MFTTRSTLIFMKLDLSESTENSWSGQPQTYSPKSFNMRRKARKETKSVMNPRDSERVLNDDGSFGKASKLASGTGEAASSLLRRDWSSSTDAMEAIIKKHTQVVVDVSKTCKALVWQRPCCTNNAVDRSAIFRRSRHHNQCQSRAMSTRRLVSIRLARL